MNARRLDGWAVSWSWVAAGFLGVISLPAYPANRLAPDIHTEYVKIPSGRDTITAYLAYPERKDPAPAVVVIHEIFGMSDFIRQTAEQLAKDGFVAIAPDLLSRRGGTPASGDSARKLIAQLDTDTLDRKSTRLNSSHGYISYAVFCLKKKKKKDDNRTRKDTEETH